MTMSERLSSGANGGTTGWQGSGNQRRGRRARTCPKVCWPLRANSVRWVTPSHARARHSPHAMTFLRFRNQEGRKSPLEWRGAL